MARRALPARPPTRERILVAALDLFAAQGYAGASIRQLARAVGIRESSIYNHFSGKDEIFAALIDSHGPASSADRLRSPQFQALRSDPSGFCRLYADRLLVQWSDQREQRFQEIIAAERNRLPSARKRYFDTLFSDEAGLVADYFREFTLRGLVKALDARETARLFMAGLTFIRLEHFIVPAARSDRRKVSAALNKFLANFLDLIAARQPAKPARS